MISRRIYLNLAAFFALFLALCLWAASNVVGIDAIERPYRVTAYFDEAPGLRANVEVTYLGVRVGQIRSVALDDGAAEVTLSIRRGTTLPAGVSAAVRRKSAAGEPYVSLEAPAGWTGDDGYLPSDGSYVIDEADTETPLSYGELFTSVDGLLAAVDPDDLGTVLGELSTALAGRGDQLRTIFRRSGDLTATLAARSGELDRLATELTALTGTIADKSSTIADSTDDLATLVGALSASTADIDALLDRAPRLATQVNDLLAASAPDIRCGIAAAGGMASVVAQPASLRQLVRLLFAAQTARVVIPKATVQGPDGPYLAGTFGFAPGSPATDYDHYIELPEPPPVERCSAEGTATGQPPGDSPRPGDAKVPAVPDGDGALAAPERAPGRGPASTDEEPDGGDFPYGVLLAGLGLLLVAATLASTRPWRRVSSVGSRTPDGPVAHGGSTDDRS